MTGRTKQDMQNDLDFYHNTNYILCPVCEEEIFDDSDICRYCGEKL